MITNCQNDFQINEEKNLIRVVQDFGPNIPVLDKKLAEQYNISIHNQSKPRKVKSFACKIKPDTEQPKT
jgi:hypothetical protein